MQRVLKEHSNKTEWIIKSISRRNPLETSFKCFLLSNLVKAKKFNCFWNPLYIQIHFVFKYSKEDLIWI
jgi:hypothetical protein